jgi:hypothetical protein
MAPKGSLLRSNGFTPRRSREFLAGSAEAQSKAEHIGLLGGRESVAGG